MVENHHVVKRVCVELSGDAAIASDILEATLHLSGFKKKDRDQVMYELGLEAIKAAIKTYTLQTGKTYPSIQDIRRMIHGEAEVIDALEDAPNAMPEMASDGASNLANPRPSC